MGNTILIESRGVEAATKSKFLASMIIWYVLAVGSFLLRSFKKTSSWGVKEYLFDDSERTILLIVAIFFLLLGLYSLNVILAIRKTMVIIYEDHIEFTTATAMEILLQAKLKTLTLPFKAIKGVTSVKQKSSLFLETQEKKYKVYIKNSDQIEKMVKSKIGMRL